MSDQVTISAQELEAMLERASQRGAQNALTAIGLHGPEAAKDVNELMGLLASYREAKRAAITTFAKIVTTAILTSIILGVGLMLKTKIGGQ
jgi:hypothetical protein